VRPAVTANYILVYRINPGKVNYNMCIQTQSSIKFDNNIMFHNNHIYQHLSGKNKF